MLRSQILVSMVNPVPVFRWEQALFLFSFAEYETLREFSSLEKFWQTWQFHVCRFFIMYRLAVFSG